MVRPRNTVLTFWASVVHTDTCWLWIGRTNGSEGYGKLSWHNADVYAHRLSWELHVGPVPLGLWVLHRCDNPPCVRPDHLFLGTHEDNMLDAARKHRLRNQWHKGSGTSATT